MNNRFITRMQQHYVRPSHPIAFSSPGNINRWYEKNVGRKIDSKSMGNALSEVDSYTLHREYKRPKFRNPFFIYSLRQQIQMDLIDFSQLAKYNDQVTFLLVVIDTFSKKAWIEPMINKSAPTSLQVITKVVNAIVPPPISVLFDKGMEFRNNLVTNFLRERNIKIIHPFSETKAPHIERFNRTIQDLIYRYMTENETFRYIDILDKLLETYNNRGHRTLKYLTPNEAEDESNHQKVANALNEYYTKFVQLNKQKPKYTVGQTVRIKTLPNRFDRGYNERFAREHFKIVEVKTRMPIPMYILQSLDNNEIISGGFYSNELQPIDISKGVFKMTVLKSRRRNGKLQHLVHWRDYGSQHDQWLDADNITKKYT
jgi:transposase InsO family protein